MSEAKVLLFPIRHHSPACAWHLERLIAERQPSAVLIEGPRDAMPLIAHLVHPATRAPVAIYTTWVDTANVLQRLDYDRKNPARFAAYYPLADFSPELVAMRAGSAIGAHLALIDLTFPEMVVAEHGSVQEQTRSLLAERYFQQSGFLRALCERTGARDPDDLWDHLYETDFTRIATDEFMRRVETYCSLARADYTADMLAAEGHSVRELAMTAAIRAATKEGNRLVLVVTGGFHTPGLRALLNGVDTPAPSTSRPTGEAQTLLMRYGFAQLDRLNGYASGMPSPAFYQRTWEHMKSAELRVKSAEFDRAEQQLLTLNSQSLTSVVAAEFIVELGRHSRAQGPGLSPADEIAALDHTQRLAAFRGHPQPAREDLLDGIRSAFVKGAADAEGALLLAMAQRLLAGDRIGELPPQVGVAPLVLDFQRAAAQHRLDITTLGPRELALDLYRSAGHRAASRFFHRLTFLTVPFAEHRAGPDFVAGTELERVQEVWRYGWTPMTESALTERSVYGGTLEEACAARLQEELRGDNERGLGRRADRAAAHLLGACRMGLHRFAADLLAHTTALIAEDAAFPSLVHTAEQLLVLHRSREPLEAHGLAGVIEAARDAYQRACYLLPTLSATSQDEEAATLDALNALQQIALALETDQRPTTNPGLSRDEGDQRTAASVSLNLLRHNGLRALVSAKEGNPAIRGAAVGALFIDGQFDEIELIRLTIGHFNAVAVPTTQNSELKTQNSPGPAFLRGLLRSDRACLWQVPRLLSKLTDVISQWDNAQFVRVLPELRLAFADLTARECDMVARQVAALVGAQELPSLLLRDAAPEDVLLGAALNGRIEELLTRDGLIVLLEHDL